MVLEYWWIDVQCRGLMIESHRHTVIYTQQQQHTVRAGWFSAVALRARFSHSVAPQVGEELYGVA